MTVQDDTGIIRGWPERTARGLGRSRQAPRLLAVVAGAFLAAADCSPPTPPSPAGTAAQPAPPDQIQGAPGRTLASDFRDFRIATYQGEALLGGTDTTFARVFEQGKPVVLNFWAGQCPPCRAEMPAFQRAADEYHGKVIFVGVDVGPYTGLGSPDDVRQLLSALDIRYPAAQAVDASPLRLYQVRGMPTTLFLSPTGRIVDEAPGMLAESQLRSRLDKLIAASS